MALDLQTRKELEEKFGNAANYVVIASVLALSTAIGIYFWWKGHKNADDYLMGGRCMTALPVALSLVTSFISAVTLMSIPALIYKDDTQYSTVVFSYVLQVWLASTFYVPVFLRLRLTTVYEYLELRFHSKALRTLASAYFALVMVLYLAVVVYTPSLALSQVTDMSTLTICGILFAVCGVYTCLGGLKAVMWTDALQFCVMLGSFCAVAWAGTNHPSVGGANVVFDRNYQAGKVQWFNFDTDMTKTTVWSTVIGNTFTGLHVFGVCQTLVQRYLACKSEHVAKRALLYNLFGMSSLLCVCVYMGMLLYAFYATCDPETSEQVEKDDQLVALFVMQVLGDYPGVPGLLVAGLLSGALSTVSSGLNALASVFLQDALLSFGVLKESNSTNSRLHLLISKVFAGSLCVVCYGFTFPIEFAFGGHKLVLNICLRLLGLVAGPLLGVFTLGIFIPFANLKGALTGFCTAILLSMWQFVGNAVISANKCDPAPRNITGCPSSWNVTTPQYTCTDEEQFAFYKLSFMWPAAIFTLWVVFIGAVVSLLTGPQDPETLAPELISDRVTCLFCWWPSRARKPLERYFASVGRSCKKHDSGSDVDQEINAA